MTVRTVKNWISIILKILQTNFSLRMTFLVLTQPSFDSCFEFR